MTVYISGPMTGLPEYNYPAFAAAKAYLQGLGFYVLSPHEAPACDSWAAYMKHDLKLLLECEAIVLLPGWKTSRGALLEKMVADNLGIEAWFIEETAHQTLNLIQPRNFSA